MWNGVLDKLAPPLHPLPGVATNAAYDFIVPLPVLHRTPPPSFVEPSPIPSSRRPSKDNGVHDDCRHWMASPATRLSTGMTTFLTSGQTSGHPVDYCSTRKMLSVFRDEMASAVPRVWCVGWISHMCVTGLTESLRPVHHGRCHEAHV